MRGRPVLAGGLSDKTTELGSSSGRGDTLEAPDSVYGWDWSATTHEGPDQIVHVFESIGAETFVRGKGVQGWTHSIDGFDGEGFKLASVYFGGGRNDFHVVATSAAAQRVRGSVVALDGQARTARVDTRVDTLKPWDELVGVCEAAAETYGSRLTFMESRQRGESLGRTLYLGAPTSAVRVRVYEKWLESPGQYLEGTNRVEVQLRPPSRVKQRVSSWGAAETFCASKTTQHLAALLGSELAPEASLHVARGVPDLERTLEVMGQQYGRAVERWLAVSGGDLDTVLERLTGAAADSRLGLEAAEHVPGVVAAPTRPQVVQYGWVASEGLLGDGAPF